MKYELANVYMRNKVISIKWLVGTFYSFNTISKMLYPSCTFIMAHDVYVYITDSNVFCKESIRSKNKVWDIDLNVPEQPRNII